MKSPLQNKHVLLGVTGSIAAYKAADLASKLTQAGALVDVLLTQSALQFVTQLTFQSVTGRMAYCDADLWDNEGHIQHIGLGKSADLLLIAPATANTLAKLANGLADNLLTVTALAATCPLLIAPAMDGGMYAHPATQANLEILRQREAILVGPAEGHLASGLSGVGRMVEPVELLGYARWVLAFRGPLHRRKVLVTASGTQEPIDPVRVIANRSSGKQGFALAQAALDQGAEVTLISGPTHLTPPVGAQVKYINTADEMMAAVMAALPETDVLIMAAAVADFKVVAPAVDKIKKEVGIPNIQLEETPDILQAVAQSKSREGWPRLTIGFAAESQNLLTNARNKLQAKKLDLIVANNISALDAGFAVDNNRITLLFPDGRAEPMPLMSKMEVAQVVLDRVLKMLQVDK
jgi:phosphopantothenoylcysteine decarboxylase/phosphopantothenate--cysteine ligase